MILRYFTSFFQSGIITAGDEPPDIRESIQEGDRIIIDEDGNASVNPLSPQVQQDFADHIKRLKDI